jgi:hypothetical protein
MFFRQSSCIGQGLLDHPLQLFIWQSQVLKFGLYTTRMIYSPSPNSSAAMRHPFDLTLSPPQGLIVSLSEKPSGRYHGSIKIFQALLWRCWLDLIDLGGISTLGLRSGLRFEKL